MFKVWVHPIGQRTWVTNAIQYETAESACDAGAGLFARWFGIDDWAVLPVIVGTKGELEPSVVTSYRVDV